MSGVTREAGTADLAWVAPAATHARLVRDTAELVAISHTEPWRVRVTERGEAALLGRWREGSDDLAVLGLWCAPRRVPVLVCDLMEIARSRGFERLLGPLTPETQVRPYLDAGLHVVERVTVLRLEHPERITAARPPSGVVIRPMAADDLAAVAHVDRISFPPFWRYDPEQLARLADEGRGSVAEEDGSVIGYTLATVLGGQGTLGRLAVGPAGRRRGTGLALASEAVVRLAEQGVRSVTLSTQSDNEASLHLYGSLGFRRLPDALVACASGPLAAPH